MATVTRKVAGGADHTVCWMAPSAIPGAPPEHHQANHGQVIELPAEEADRLADVLVGPDDEVDAPAQGFVAADDEALSAMSVAEVTAYLGQVPEALHDDELDRILSLENDREKPRVGILSLDPDFEPHPDDPDPASA